MNTEDEAYDRLVAADPAADAVSRPGVLRAKTDAQAGAQADGAPWGSDGAAGAESGDPAARRRRTRAPWLVAAAVAGAVAVGGGGYALGSSEAGTVADEAASDALPPITLGDARGAAPGGSEAAGDGTALAESGDDAAGTADVTLPGWYDGRSVFSASGLSGEAGTATAYAYDARDVGTRATAARSAEALGVSGEPRWEWGSWNVGAGDGDGPGLWLSADGTGTFSFNDPAADPWRCADTPVETMEREDSADGGGDDMVEPAPACEAPGDPEISPEDAIDEVRGLMERLGADPGTFTFEAPDDGGEGAVRVNARQVVEGQETGATWSATVGDDGIAWLDGFLAETVPLGDYPVVSPAAAVERLGVPRFAGSSWPVAFAAGSEAMPEERGAEEDGSEPTPPPAPPSSGADLPWPVSEVTITQARLGLTQHHDADGSVLLLPAYELSDAAGNTWSVLAVAEEALDTTSS